jgi:outer membrane lipoprotein-sorting protein
MRAYRFGIVALAFTCLTTLPPTAQQAKPQTAQQVFSRMAQVMGLEKAAKVRTVQMAGTVEYTLEGLRGRIEVFIKSPNKMLVKTTIEGVGEFVSAYNGKVGWEKDPRSGVREARGERLTQMRESAREGAGNDVRKLIRNATLVGKETIDGREAFVIEGATALGGPITVYIDAQRYVPIRIDKESLTPQGKMDTVTYYSDYRKVDGIMYPFTMRRTADGLEMQVKVTRVKHNAPISDAIFQKPKR